jgi:hypothetical protein
MTFKTSSKLDFLQKSGKEEGERGKGLLFSLSPLTFSQLLQKELLQEVYCLLSSVNNYKGIFFIWNSSKPESHKLFPDAAPKLLLSKIFIINF